MFKKKSSVERFITKGTKKINYKGTQLEEKVFRVRLSDLFFNDKNGRIATYIIKYERENSKKINELSTIEDYNNVIDKFIKEANGFDNFKRIKTNMKNLLQLEPGVILEDGRIIDGNRRFASLRELYKETSDDKYAYFECIILPEPSTQDDEKEIKSLELILQQGTPEKIGYDPVDRLVDVYRDLIETKLFLPEEYAKKIDETTAEVKKLIGKAEIMADFCTEMGISGDFYVIKDLKLDGPIDELYKFKKSLSKDEWEKYRIVFYTYMITSKGDRVRIMRDIKTTMDKKQDLKNNLIEGAIEIYDNIKSVTKENSNSEDKIRKIKSDEDLITNANEMFDNFAKNAGFVNIISKPKEKINKALEEIREIDNEIVKKLNRDDKKEIKKNAEYIMKIIENLLGVLKDV
jgi:hypothetical protein